MARVVTEFEDSLEILKHKQSKGPNLRHHEQVKGVQESFRKQVASLCEVMEGMGNPFLEASQDVLVLDTRDIVEHGVVETIQHIERLGREQVAEFIEERLEQRKKSLFEPLRKNKLPLFSTPPQRNPSNDKQQIVILKKNCALFSQLYVSCQVRSSDLGEFFQHENLSYPPAIRLWAVVFWNQSGPASYSGKTGRDTDRETRC